MQDCINFRYPIEYAENTTELSEVVQRMLIQYELTVYQVLNPEADYEELAEIISGELDDAGAPIRPEIASEINTVVYWMELAQRRSAELM